MLRRQLARGCEVSALGLGTVSLGINYGIAAPGQFGRPSDQDALALLSHAANQGITLFDTAPAYGDAEHLLGEALGTRPESLFATKVSLPRGADGRVLRGEALAEAVAASLRRSCAALKRPHLDLVQIHNATVEVLADGELTRLLQEARRRGELKLLGASVYSEAEALAAIEAGFDVLQVAYNLLDQRMAARALPAAKRAGVGVLVRSAFLKGALSEKALFLPEPLSPLKRAVERVCAHFEITWAELPTLALRFCLSHPAVSTVLVGARTVAELDAGLAAAKAGPLPAELLDGMASLAIDDERLLNPSHWPVA